MKIRKLAFHSLLFLILIGLNSCSASKTSAGRTKKPDWVKDRPVSEKYYIGIGMAKTYESNYIKVAKNNALTDMISEISVKISSNSVLRQFEDDAAFKEEFESVTKTHIKDELEGYQLVDTWKGKNDYWVYYRLSKEKYKRIKREKLEKAKELSKDFYEQARKAEKSYQIANALNYYVKAFEAVKTHLDEDLSVFTLDGRINLGNKIYQNIQEIFSSITFEPARQVFHIRALSSDNAAVEATVFYDKQGDRRPIADFPVTFSFPNSNIDKTEEVRSNNSGMVTCSMASMAPKGKQQKIKMALNTDIFFGKNSKNQLLNQMFASKSSIPYDYLIVNVKELKAYFESNETEFGKPASGKPVTQLFKKALSEEFFSFVPKKEKADVIVKVSANTTKGKKMNNYDLHTAYLNCNISITKTSDSAEIYSTGLNNIKGMKTGGFHMAAKDAREKAEKKIEQKIISDLRKINF